MEKDKDIALATAFSFGRIRENIYTDVTVLYSADAYYYVLQAGSSILVSIATGLLTSTIYEKLKKAERKKQTIKITDLYTREVKDGIIKYRKIIDELNFYKENETGQNKKEVELYLIDSKRCLKILEEGKLDGKQLRDILFQYKDMTKDEVAEYLEQFNKK